MYMYVFIVEDKLRDCTKWPLVGMKLCIFI